jgi:hypothetical protein
MPKIPHILFRFLRAVVSYDLQARRYAAAVTGL